MQLTATCRQAETRSQIFLPGRCPRSKKPSPESESSSPLLYSPNQHVRRAEPATKTPSHPLSIAAIPGTASSPKWVPGPKPIFPRTDGDEGALSGSAPLELVRSKEMGPTELFLAQIGRDGELDPCEEKADESAVVDTFPEGGWRAWRAVLGVFTLVCCQMGYGLIWGVRAFFVSLGRRRSRRRLIFLPGQWCKSWRRRRTRTPQGLS